MSASTWDADRIAGLRYANENGDRDPNDFEDALVQIERLTAALKAANDRADAAEARLRRYEGGSYAGMLDRT